MRPQPALSPAELGVLAERLGPLPLINHFLQRLRLLELLERHVPTTDARSTVSHAQALGVLLRSIIVEREPIYRQQETTSGFAQGLFGIDAAQAARLSDDRIGRALDRLFDADRGALLTEVVLALGQRFGVRLKQLHNDSTSISLCGQYRNARGRSVRGRTAPAIVHGYSKDHRPDLKQLLFILTTDAEGGVPVHFRCADGNTTDVRTHIETWNTLRALAGRADFLYIADSNQCATWCPPRYVIES
jgi:transposase